MARKRMDLFHPPVGAPVPVGLLDGVRVFVNPEQQVAFACTWSHDALRIRGKCVDDPPILECPCTFELSRLSGLGQAGRESSIGTKIIARGYFIELQLPWADQFAGL